MNPWELIIQQPLINVLIVMSHYLANNFGVAIIVLTIIINVAMLPLTLKQIHSTRAIQELQPRLAELQQKYGKDKQKMAQEQMRLYRESGVKPAGCAVTMVIQMPIWIALYQSIMLSLAVAPEGLLNLSKYLYPWSLVYSMLPLNSSFLGLDLAAPNFIMAILVGASMWLQQKMTMTMPTDPKQRQQSQMMLYMMPLLFGFLALSFPSGLSLFWVTSSITRVALQYRSTGWSGIKREETREVIRDKKRLSFISNEKDKPEDDVRADIVVDGSNSRKSDKDLGYQNKPNKNRYLPGRDRTRKQRKK